MPRQPPRRSPHRRIAGPPGRFSWHPCWWMRHPPRRLAHLRTPRPPHGRARLRLLQVPATRAAQPSEAGLEPPHLPLRFHC
eukprot:scaffold1272_cov250-Pinguiococcus_pyrenoidosus.AAC.40